MQTGAVKGAGSQPHGLDFYLAFGGYLVHDSAGPVRFKKCSQAGSFQDSPKKKAVFTCLYKVPDSPFSGGILAEEGLKGLTPEKGSRWFCKCGRLVK
jgi:hypothetical protein